MNLLINIIISLSLIISLVSSQTYVQMIPYKTQTCTGEEYGIGYNWLVDTCIGFRADNFYVTVDKEHNNVTFTEYDRSDNCDGNNPSSERTFVVGDCYMVNYAGNEQYPQNNYVKIAIVNNPPPPPEYGLKFSVFAPTDNYCNGNVQMNYYYTNGTTWQDEFDTYVFFCSQDESYETVCGTSNDDENNLTCFTSTWQSACGPNFYHFFKNYAMTTC